MPSFSIFNIIYLLLLSTILTSSLWLNTSVILVMLSTPSDHITPASPAVNHTVGTCPEVGNVLVGHCLEPCHHPQLLYFLTHHTETITRCYWFYLFNGLQICPVLYSHWCTSCFIHQAWLACNSILTDFLHQSRPLYSILCTAGTVVLLKTHLTCHSPT